MLALLFSSPLRSNSRRERTKPPETRHKMTPGAKVAVLTPELMKCQECNPGFDDTRPGHLEIWSGRDWRCQAKHTRARRFGPECRRPDVQRSHPSHDEVARRAARGGWEVDIRIVLADGWAQSLAAIEGAIRLLDAPPPSWRMEWELQRRQSPLVWRTRLGGTSNSPVVRRPGSNPGLRHRGVHARRRVTIRSRSSGVKSAP